MSFTVRRVERNETHECLPVCLQREWRWGVWRTRPTGRPKPTEWWVHHSQHNRLLYVRFRLPMTPASLWASASVAQMGTFVRTSADLKSRPCNYTLDVSNDADLKKHKVLFDGCCGAERLLVAFAGRGSEVGGGEHPVLHGRRVSGHWSHRRPSLVHVSHMWGSQFVPMLPLTERCPPCWTLKR